MKTDQLKKTKQAVSITPFTYQEIRSAINSMLPSPITFNDDDNLIEFGLDSLKIMRIVNLCRRSGAFVTFAKFIENPCLRNWWNLLQGNVVQFPEKKEKRRKFKRNESKNKPFALTDVQYAYWIGRRDDQPLGGVGCHAYLELDGYNVDPIRLESAWKQILMHHPMLRARFLSDGVQEVMSAPFSDTVSVHDLRDSSKTKAELKLKQIRDKLSHRRLAVEKGEVVGLELSLLPQGHTRLHFDIDLLVADVQSFHIILRDLASAYGRGVMPSAPTHWDFSWYLNQEEQRRSKDKEKSALYWKERLQTLPGAPGLPLMRVNPETIKRPVFKRRSYTLNSEDWSCLKKRCLSHKVTPAMVLLTVYAEILDRWSTHSRFLINMPLFDRQIQEPGIEDVVADFTNLLLLEIDFTTPKSFLERLRSVQDQFYQDVAHASYSGVQVQRDMARVRLGERMFAPVVFACNLGTELITPECSETLGQFSYMISQTPQVWLDFQSYEMDDELLLAWDAVDELFPDGLIDQMFEAYTRYIKWLAIENKEWAISLNILPINQQQRRDIDVALSVPKETQCLHTQFFQFADTHPQNIALIDSYTDTQTTYDELSQYSLKIAAFLRENGVNKGDLVAVTLHRGIEQVGAVLGILACGACYVPVGMEQPFERRSRILQKAKIRYVLSQKHGQTLEWPDNITVFNISDAEDVPPLIEPLEISPENLAYIIFTSGSTGEPKGVEIEHCTAWNTIVEINRRYQVNESDRILAISALDFDLSVYDIFGLLSSGGSLVLITDEMRREAEYWLKTLDKYEITLWNSVPILLNMLLVVAESRPQNILPLRLAMLSGDWIGLDLPERLNNVAKNCHMVAMGGATEASIWSNAFDVTVPLPARWKSVPYGRPLANQAYRVVDSKGRDCPDWVAGELWIGGAGVARGYCGEPELSAERFVIWNNSRWYRTGDLGRFWPDGNIEFLGREDFQVKIRGHRIELGEIESALKQHSDVRETFVTTIDDHTSGKRLVCYIVPENEKSESLFDIEQADEKEKNHLWYSLINAGEKQVQKILKDITPKLSSKLSSLFWEIIEDLSIIYICRALTGVRGFKTSEEKRYTSKTVMEIYGIHPRYMRLIEQWLKILEQEGLLKIDGDNSFIDHLISLARVREIKIAQKLETHPNLNKYVENLKEYLEKESRYIVGLLTGDIDPLNLFFADEPMLSPEYLTQLLPGSEYVNSIIKEIITIAQDSNSKKRALRILEIGSRTGIITELLLPLLSLQHVDYTYTDTSTFFINKGKDKFKNYDFVQYQLLDINQNPQEQGYEAHDYDIIIAANSLHRTLNIEVSLEYVQSLLAPGGLLIASEITKNSCLQSITVGFIEGFDSFHDQRRENNLPLLSRNEWEHLLHSSGFKSVATFPQVTSSEEFNFYNNVMVAQASLFIKRFNPNSLINWLEQSLPEYMVPLVYVPLKSLPLTANGKIDRKKLPALKLLKSEPESKFVAPQTSVQVSLADIWRQVFKIERIGIQDNFFELGGDSLLAVQMTTRITNALNINLSLEHLFKSPTIAELSDYIDIHYIDTQVQGETEKTASLPQITPDPENRYMPFPLTDIQQAYWIGRSGVYELGNVSTHCYFEIEGADLDHERITKAWQRLIDHHDMMRVVILPDGQQQRILEKVPPYSIRILDLRGKDLQTTESELMKLRDEMSHQVISTDQWPLFDVRLSYFGENSGRLHISFDNLIFDGWSMFHLLREWTRLYDNPDASLHLLDLSFRDYVLMQERFKESDLYQKDRDYWFNRLHSLPPAPELPLSRDPSSFSQQKFSRLDTKLNRQTWQYLKKRTAGLGLTPSGILLAAYAEVLGLWSRSFRFTINLTLFNRLAFHPQVNDIIGDFTSLTLLSVDNSAKITFLERALNLQQQLWKDLDHPYVGGVQVQRELARQHGEQQGAVMPVVFTSALGVDQWNEDSSGRNWMGKLVHNITQTPQVWLDHQVVEQDGELLLIWDAVKGLFPKGMLDEMFDAYCTLLKGLAKEDELWHQLSPITIPESQLKQRDSVNATKSVIYPEMLHTLFWNQVYKDPDHIALICSKRNMSYRELFHYSNQIGHLLKEKGAQPNTLVAVVMEKGWEQVVATLGILASGAAYLPIDPAVPKERLCHVLENAQVDFCLTQSWLEKRIEWPETIQCLFIDEIDKLAVDKLDSLNLPVFPPKSMQGPEDLAYVIYTSGSTGVPKGVMIDHRGPVNTIIDINRRFNIGSKDRVLALSNLNFDLSVYDIFGILAAGGTIVLPDASGFKDPAHWLKLMIDEQVTIWNSVPALMEMLVEHISGRNSSMPQSLYLTLLSGDWIPLDLADKIKTMIDNVEVISLGGATEASIWSILYPIKQVGPDWKSIPYGQPMVNQNFYVLNELMDNCPDFVPGQMYIGGIGLAKGYWRDEQKSNNSFIIHPKTRERLYRTGDLGRWMPDGNIEFIGRVDFQVKIDGNRIELGEIESVLKKCPGVINALVTVVQDTTKRRKLAAYVINEDKGLQNSGTSFDPEKMRQFVEQFLPDYMVPSIYISMESFPLTANGKIDRKSLPEPSRELLECNASMIMPQTFLDSEVAEIWKLILGSEKIGINNNFFELGGDSLLAVKLINTINKKFQVELCLPDLFHHPNVAEISEKVRFCLSNETSKLTVRDPLPIIIPDTQGLYTEFPLTDVQQAYMIGRSSAYELGNVSTHIYAEFERKNTDIKQLNIAFRNLINTHDMLRMVVMPGGKQKILENVPLYEFKVIDYRNQSDKTVEEGIIDTRNKMSHQMLPVDKWPLFDIRISVIDNYTIRIHLSFDALIVDAWSLFIVLRDWFDLYDNPNQILKKSELSFRDYVLAQEEVRKSPLYQRDKEFALSRLPELPSSPALPLARTLSSVQKPHFKRYSSSFDKDKWDKLKTRAAQNGITPSGVLLGIYALVIAHYSKSSSFTLNLTLFNRLPLHQEVNEVVGDFTSLTLLAIDAPGEDSFLTWVQKLQYELWEVAEHRYFSGVDIIREFAALTKNYRGAAFPVVFTSALGYDEKSGEHSTLSRMGDFVYGITQTPQVTLDHQVMERDGELLYHWDVVESVFPKGMIQEMFDAYALILAMLSDDDTIWDIKSSKLLPKFMPDKHSDFNDTDNSVSSELLHTLFNKKAKIQPNYPAVVTPDMTIDYGTLRKRATHLGKLLASNNAQPNSLIAVMMKKGWEQVVALLGILNSGAAYLPLDPDLPKERISHLLQHAEIDTVLTRSCDDYNKTLISMNVKTIDVDLLEPGDEEDSIEKFPLQNQDDLAYVIYTSGSTGLPKGVMIDHKGAVNTILDINSRFSIDSKDKVLALSELSFDLSVYDIFGTLAAGGTIVMPSSKERKDPGHWMKMIKDNGVTVWNSVPMLMQMLIEHVSGRKQELPSSLGLILLSGDWIPLDLPSRIYALSDKVQLISLGGATEASIWSIIYPINKSVPDRWKSIPYGRPMLNQKFYVLNDFMEKCPDWVHGDLYIGGIGLAKGYFKDSDRTQKSFIIHPDTKEPLYRTGDLGCYHPDGYIEFLGRDDFQVKVGGYRIELGEIESTLKRHSSVSTAAVKVIKTCKTDAFLAAYVVAKTGDTVSQDHLKNYLSSKIPIYMVPKLIIMLDSMPLTPNGKIDRKALPEPDEINIQANQSYHPPGTDMEKAIVDICKSVIRLEKMDVKASFFDLGANSLHLVQIQNKLQTQLNCEVSIINLFEYPNVRHLAGYLTNQNGNIDLSNADKRALKRRLIRGRRRSIRK